MHGRVACNRAAVQATCSKTGAGWFNPCIYPVLIFTLGIRISTSRL
jgi:hypothetical protein